MKIVKRYLWILFLTATYSRGAASGSADLKDIKLGDIGPIQIGANDLSVVGYGGSGRLVIARNGTGAGTLEVYELHARGWRLLWRSRTIAHVDCLVPAASDACAAISCGKEILLLTERLKKFNLIRVGTACAPIRRLTVRPSRARCPGRILYIAGGMVLKGHPRGTRLYSASLTPPLRPVLQENVRARHNAVDMSCGDIDGDGVSELMVTAWTRTQVHPESDNRPYLYSGSEEQIWPKWMGSRLANPFVWEALGDIQGRGVCDLVAAERANSGAFCLSEYQWRGFGFRQVTGCYLDDRPLSAQIGAASPGAPARVLVQSARQDGTQCVKVFGDLGGSLSELWRSADCRTAAPVGMIRSGDREQIAYLADGHLLVGKVNEALHPSRKSRVQRLHGSVATNEVRPQGAKRKTKDGLR